MGEKKTERFEVLEYRRGRPLDDVVRELAEQGMNWNRIAKELGVSRVTLQSWRRDRGWKMRQTVVRAADPSPAE